MFVLLITLDLLRRYSRDHSGIVYFRSTDDLSDVQSFAYNYVPIILALVLVILWSFVDFDVLRLEPYFQMARPDGAPASVLFINYNFGQTFLTPITSAKRGHWVVLTVSMLTLLTRIFLPALQSTLLELREVNVTASNEMNTWPHLVPPPAQARWIASQEQNNFDSAYAKTDDLHRSRSADFAVAPVEIPAKDPRESTLWSVNQTIYWSQLACHDVMREDQLPVAVNDTVPDHPWVSWTVDGIPLPAAGTEDDPDPCTVDFHYHSIMYPSTDFMQVRYWEPSGPAATADPDPDVGRRAFAARRCSPYDLYGVLISINASDIGASSIRATGPQYTSSATMFACNVEYLQAEATVSMHANSSITKVEIQEDTTAALTRSEFDLGAFHGLLAHRAPYTSDTIFMEYNSTAGDRTITELPMISQDLGDLEPVLVLDSWTVMTQPEFQNKVTRGVKQAFVMTMSRLFNPDEPPTTVPAVKVTRQVSIAVVTFAALWSEVILALGGLLAVILLYFYHHRPNILQSDPGSIGAMCSMLTDVFGACNILTDPNADYHEFSTIQLRRLLRHSRLHWYNGPLGRRLEIVPPADPPPAESERLRARVDPRPHFLVIPIFIVEFLLLTAVIAVMAVIIASLAHEGSFQHLTQSDSSFFQIVLSFMPSVVASSVGALCNSIHRNLSILEPWVHLQRGMASAGRSLSMNYASQNPWAVFIKTLRHRHPLLGLVSLACVANTLLTVVAGGLFTQQLTQSNLPTENIRTNYSQSVFHQTDFAADFTEYDLIQTSITSGVPMLAWTSPNRSFVPLKVNNPDADALYNATTMGIGAELECRPLSLQHDLTEDPTTRTASWTYPMFEHPSRTCTVNMTALNRTPGGISMSIHFLSPVAQDDWDACQTSTVMIVARWHHADGAAMAEHNTIALHCEPRVHVQNYTVTFDYKGQVQAYTPRADAPVTSGSMYDNATISLGQFNKMFAAIPQSYVEQAPGKEEEQGDYEASYDWAGFLVARLYKQRQTNATELHTPALIDMTQVVYQWVYSTYFSLWREIYLEPLDEGPVAPDATIMYSLWCMVPSVPSLALALIIIALDTLVVLVVFGTRRGRFQGPRIPRSIGAVLPWLAHSRMMGDFHGTYTWTSERRRKHLNGLDKRYGFRQFTGVDGRWRYAVDEEDCPTEDKAGKTGVIELREIREQDSREQDSRGQDSRGQDSHGQDAA
ncbi:hypothetical protein BDW42DRAFT_88653 [Aspergillus taichungensis]|uniref:Uncharacterized protein n=1 Tax=Aspergillus taichungensis TaxID=482145 RepID=A0A2J5HWT0_9EURO|nr:hypothetical protein BDW42DRAFT_88653 [Aspergillus taichungensis]